MQYAWLCAAVICDALVISLRPNTTEPVIRLTGLVLQLFGVATVIWGISKTREDFGLPSLASKTKEYLSKFSLLRRSCMAEIKCASAQVSAGKLRAYEKHVPGENSTSETRLEALEKNISLIHERITQTQKEMDEELCKTRMIDEVT